MEPPDIDPFPEELPPPGWPGDPALPPVPEEIPPPPRPPEPGPPRHAPFDLWW